MEERYRREAKAAAGRPEGSGALGAATSPAVYAMTKGGVDLRPSAVRVNTSVSHLNVGGSRRSFGVASAADQ